MALQRRTPLKRTRFERRPASNGVPAGVLAGLAARSGGRCEMTLPGCQGWATDPCHRNGRKAGGRRGDARALSDRLSNLIHGCRACHDWTHAHPAEALAAGLMLREGDDPPAVPALLYGLRRQRSWLADDGTVGRGDWPL